MDERAQPAAARGVNRAGDPSLTRAVLALDQHGRRQRGHPGDLLAEFFDGVRLTEDRLAGGHRERAGVGALRRPIGLLLRRVLDDHKLDRADQDAVPQRDGVLAHPPSVDPRAVAAAQVLNKPLSVPMGQGHVLARDLFVDQHQRAAVTLAEDVALLRILQRIDLSGSDSLCDRQSEHGTLG